MKWLRQAPMTQVEMEAMLSRRLRKSISLDLHENRSVFLRYEEAFLSARLRLHRSFLYASEEVLSHLLLYLYRKKRRSLGFLRLFLQQPFFFHKVVVDKKNMEGKFYNLENIYETVRTRDLPSTAALSVSWFQAPRRKKMSSMTYGFFCPTRQLIAINRRLDDPKVPNCFLEYVVYHEALHAVFPPIMNAKGDILVHTKEFRKKEKQFPKIKEALAFEKIFFKKVIREKAQHGRA